MSVKPLTLSEKISWSSPEANDDDDVNQLVELASSIELKEIENNKTKIHSSKLSHATKVVEKVPYSQTKL
jgi:hypothetical protein